MKLSILILIALSPVWDSAWALDNDSLITAGCARTVQAVQAKIDSSAFVADSLRIRALPDILDSCWVQISLASVSIAKRDMVEASVRIWMIEKGAQWVTMDVLRGQKKKVLEGLDSLKALK